MSTITLTEPSLEHERAKERLEYLSGLPKPAHHVCSRILCKCHRRKGQRIKANPLGVPFSIAWDGRKWISIEPLPTTLSHAASNGLTMKAMPEVFKVLPAYKFQEWCTYQIHGVEYSDFQTFGVAYPKDCSKICTDRKSPRPNYDAVWMCSEHFRMRRLELMRVRSYRRLRARGAHEKDKGMPKEIREKISTSRKGILFSPEHRDKISAAKKGKKLNLSPEQREQRRQQIIRYNEKLRQQKQQ